LTRAARPTVAYKDQAEGGHHEADHPGDWPVGLGDSGQAQEVLAPNPDIEATIQSQFDAFLDRDVGEAWQYASPNIQSLFGSAENFGRMVEQGYPMVWTPGQVEFIDLQRWPASSCNGSR
jgi:hypothetical protein